MSKNLIYVQSVLEFSNAYVEVSNFEKNVIIKLNTKLHNKKSNELNFTSKHYHVFFLHVTFFYRLNPLRFTLNYLRRIYILFIKI